MVTAIDGTAGVGKTALAIHAAHQLLNEFPDGHLYADLRGYVEGREPAEPGEVLEIFLRSLGVPAGEMPGGVEAQSGLLRQMLASRRVLMVLDNARSEAQVRPLLPGAGGSLVLVTSRSALPGLEVDERIGLDILPTDEAAAMLAELTGDIRTAAEPEALVALARLCGGLPLALRIAGQLLATHPTWPIARLVQMLASEQGRLARLGAGDLQVRTAFEVSFHQMAGEDARLFRLLGLHPGPEFNVLAAAALAGTGAEAAALALDRLAEAHLLTENASGRFRMHDLLRLFALGTCQEADSATDRAAAETRLVSLYIDLAGVLDACVDPQLRAAEEQAEDQTRHPLPSMWEALAVFQRERLNMMAVLDLAAQRGWDEQVRQLSEGMADSLRVTRYFDDLITIQEIALAAARRTGDTLTEGRRLNGLGNAFGELRRLEEAIACFQQSLEIFRETGYQLGEGQVLGNLGAAYAELRRFKEAISCFQQSLEIVRETGDRFGESRALNNLGNAYADLRRFEEAITCYQQAIEICRETGTLHDEGQAVNNLGLALLALRRSEQAITCLQQSLEISQATGDQFGEAQALSNLGLALRAVQQPEKAAACYQQALAIWRKTGNCAAEAMTLGSLGNAYQELRQSDRAATSWREAAATMRNNGANEIAEQLEQLAENAQSQLKRRRWRVRHRSTS